MPSITKRGPYRYDAAVRRRGFPPQYKTFRTFEEAEVWAMETESKLLRGDFLARKDSVKQTVGDALLRYLAEISPHKKGHRWEKHRIERLLKTDLAQYHLGNLKPQTLADYRDAELERGLATNTVRLDLALISHLYRICQTEWGMPYLDNPAKHIRKPKPSKERDRRLHPHEEALIREKAEPMLRCMIFFAVETGMRRSEFCGLRWSDIRGRGAYLMDTKNGEGRAVPLSTKALAILEEVRQLRPGDGLVFGWGPDHFSHKFIDLMKECGIEGLKPHDLRHEFVCRLFEKGLDPVKISKMTGHKSLQMLRRYASLGVEDLARDLD